jgi:hypothetical protein
MRQRIQVKVTLMPVLDANGKPWASAIRHATSLDLSERGIRLSHCGFLPLGSIVRAVFRIPDGAKYLVACYARVVRLDARKHPGYGLKFIDFGPGTTRRIRSITWRFRALTPQRT